MFSREQIGGRFALLMLRSVLIARLFLSVKELMVFMIRWLTMLERSKQFLMGSLLSDIVLPPMPPPTSLLLPAQVHAVSAPRNIQTEKRRPLSMSGSTGDYAFLGARLQGKCAMH